MVEGERHGLARDHREPRPADELVDLDGHGAGEGQHVGAAPGHDAPCHRLEEGGDEAVLGAGGVAHRQLDLAPGARQPAQQDARRAGAELVAPLVAAHGQRIGEHDGPRRRAEGGLQHHRVLDVAAADVRRTRRVDRPVPGCFVEDPPEDRGPVEAGEAQPVDRARPADQGGRTTVGEQGVIGDRQMGHDRLPQSGAWDPWQSAGDAGRHRLPLPPPGRTSPVAQGAGLGLDGGPVRNALGHQRGDPPIDVVGLRRVRSRGAARRGGTIPAPGSRAPGCARTCGASASWPRGRTGPVR